ncbi:MAG: ATP-binding protein, partial [Proteobacteria bacterium]|nr:ATP-binding protein [Pseudomonadota bacterium]
NLVYMELLRKGYDVKVGYINGKEIDFIAEKRNKKVYIQVTYHLGNPKGDTYKREYAPLLAIKDNYPKYILSTEGKIASEGEYGINRINIEEFLLKNEL